MDEPRPCIACGAALAGPFRPKIGLTLTRETEQKVTARSWICPGCGLVHWYAEDVAGLTAAIPADEAETLQPDSSYQRRAQMLRMLRRVRRM